MIKTQDLERIVALTLYSSYVKDEKPVSLMIISDRPEAGKSEVVNKFYGNTGTVFLSDVTAYALWRDFKLDFEAGNVRHLIIPEFLAPLSRKSETVNSLISTLQMLIEEGIMEVHTGFLKPIKFKLPITVGVVLCMPRGTFLARRSDWAFSGFLSRFMVASYKYDGKTVDDIFRSIENREYIGQSRIPLDFPAEQVAVNIPPGITTRARSMVVKQTAKERESGRSYGFRELKHILRMLSARVLLENAKTGSQRDEVEMADFEEVEYLSYLINEEFNVLKGD